MDDEVEGGGDLLPDGLDGQVVAGHQHHGLHARERVARRVRVDRGQRPVVARVHRLQHVQGLGPADLADDDPIRPHAQRIAHQIADRYLALALDVLGPRLQAQDVALVELELGCVLDRHDPLRVGDRRREGVEQRRLA